MENSIINGEKDSQRIESLLQCLSKDVESAKDDNLSKRLVTKVNPGHVPILSFRNSQSRDSCIEESFFQGICTLENQIPKQIVCFDEKYVRRCLELIHISSLKAASRNMGVFPDGLSSRDISNGSLFDMGRFFIECPSVAGTENVIVCDVGDSIIGSITGSKSMINILKSPLFRRSGALDRDVIFGKSSLVSDGESISSDFTSSPGGLCASTSKKLQKEMTVNGDHRYTSEPVHKRLVSISSTNSTISDMSSSTSGAISQGLLQCTWDNGFPRYVFSVDDQKEIYVANLMKVESPDDKVLDYIYTFHSKGKKENDIHEKESALVGKMRVSTSITLGPNNTEFMETQFVLFGSSSDHCVGEVQNSLHTLRKNKGLSKKVVDVFRATHSSKQRISSKHRQTSAILEDSSQDPFQEFCQNLDPQSEFVLSENHLPPNAELAAIIVKDHIHENHKEEKIGGWGMKFLKKLGSRQINESLEVSKPPECCERNSGDCSTSLDILIPAGFHGGPRTRNGGPSSLTERWRSGGSCDCGGWDIGCALTVLKVKPSKNEGSPKADILKESKTFDFLIQGSKQGTSIMKMVNIHDGLYYIHFQSTLSALQSFSIAAAIIHTHSPTLRAKVYRS